MEEYYTPPQVAKKLHVRPSTIYWLLNTGQMKAFRMGNRWKIPESSVKVWAEQMMEGELNEK